MEFLQSRPGEEFTANEIAVWITENYPAECADKLARSKSLKTDARLLNQLVSEISGNKPKLQKKHPQIKTVEDSPRRFYWTEKTDEEEVREAEGIGAIEGSSQPGEPPTQESYLYPLVSEFLWSELQVHSKRIDERKSSNRRGPGGNRWLYPDIVGMEDLSAEWHPEIAALVSSYADKKTKLWSIEVKKLLNRSNVRESYFQTVSNSSWANFGYLISEKIEGAETMKELRMLFALHGIGVIKLDVASPTESQIVIPARERSEIDWTTANRLADENADFTDYLKLVREFYQTGNPRAHDWDFPATD